MHLTDKALFLSSSLVFIAIIFSYKEKINLEKDIIIGALRAVVQLLVVGYFLSYIFSIDSFIFTTIILLFMIFNASRTSAKKAKYIKNIQSISFISIALGSFITLAILILTDALVYTASQIIPVAGMIISNSMVALSLAFKNMDKSFKEKSVEIETKLSLGADIKKASMDIIRDSIKTGMVPTIDSSKTLGIVSLPGMMSGLILAGVNPLDAVKYQIMVTFMLISTTSIASFIASYLAYKSFFNERKQLIYS